ncbi:hypothetical protein Dtox_3990 [Desulfofarcimen acetoxidans DSM 771]|uniref:Uncharacterized protein n=1 Tax=Desulfofarcimen acetoxidans (strain ATCC 49208 / DSM 771 / KCTC 5769 / VKM B-1644 / 5575) TaxID=485916 RepID=C8VY54_DESAS|nr:hypothetical protein [Desulfofarcimen acetoxidans]ACV64683.1 hypothetical protein Dtox_3990 [Desulfofarcimen acetoxidans DSM 771]
MPLIELSLLYKGLVVMGKFLVGHGAIAGKAFIALKSAIAAYGLPSVISTVVTTGIVIGGIKWTEERITNVQKIVRGLQEEDYQAAIENFVRLSIATHIPQHVLIDRIGDYLSAAGNDYETIQKVKGALYEIKKHIDDEN